MQSKDKPNNVMNIPVKNIDPPLVLYCAECGNQTFFLHQSGILQCSHCDGVPTNVMVTLTFNDDE